MKQTAIYCLAAQNFSDAAKGCDGRYYAYKNIPRKIEDIMCEARVDRNRYRDRIDDLYYEKSRYILKAAKSAKKENVRVVYDDCEGCVYFEFPFGQVSFHFLDLYDELKDVEIAEHEWSGKGNSYNLLVEYLGLRKNTTK